MLVMGRAVLLFGELDLSLGVSFGVIFRLCFPFVNKPPLFPAHSCAASLLLIGGLGCMLLPASPSLSGDVTVSNRLCSCTCGDNGSTIIILKTKENKEDCCFVFQNIKCGLGLGLLEYSPFFQNQKSSTKTRNGLVWKTDA